VQRPLAPETGSLAVEADPAAPVALALAPLDRRPSPMLRPSVAVTESLAGMSRARGDDRSSRAGDMEPAIVAKRSWHGIIEPPDGATGALAVVAPPRGP
jgi:hypothetical protein